MSTVKSKEGSSALIEAYNPFKDWAEGMVAQGELNEKSVEKYRPLWEAWRWWLSSAGQEWPTATASTIEKFLQGPAPEKGGRRRALNPSRMASYTRQRYWRLLRGVYATAVTAGQLQSNPALDVPEECRPTISSRDRESQILEPMVFRHLKDPGNLVSLIKVQSEADWWHVRDRAMLAVLVDTGITTSELIALRGMDLCRADRQAMTLHQSELLNLKPPPLVIDIMQTKESIDRQLQISPPMAPLLIEWLRLRASLLLERSARTTRLSERSAYMQAHASQAPLFVARRARSAASELPPMEATSVYHTVSVTLKALRESLAEVLPAHDAPYVAKGPAVIRNSVIRHWLDTLGPSETVARAGLKNIESLRLKVV